MKTFVEEIKSFPVLASITCDCCKKTLTNDDGWEFTIGKQEFICIDTTAGYGALMGDQNRIELDMCQECQVKILGDFIRVTEWNRPTVTANEWLAEYTRRVAANAADTAQCDDEKYTIDMGMTEQNLIAALQFDRDQ